MKTSRTKTRERQLAAIRERRARETERPAIRDHIAEAVHRAVCRHTGTDGLGFCHHYAVGGHGLLRRVFKKELHLQAGSLHILLDDDSDLTTSMDGSNWRNGELHIWLANQDAAGRYEIVDFAARHYRAYHEQLPRVCGEWAEWNRPDPPLYIWCYDRPPHWLKLIALPEPTAAVWANKHSSHQKLVDLCVEEYTNGVING